jgi:galactose-1-phosphate uridylyltransferase
MEFTRHTQTSRFYSPLEEFQEVAVEVEVREDPLTGRQARVVPESFVMPEETPDVEAIVGDGEGCFFCPGMVTEATPEYPDWVGMDRGSVGEATSFPNLNPYGAHSNVVALTEDHFHPIDELTVDHFADGLTAALEYVNTVLDHDEDAAMASVNMNFLRSAGSSLYHPHMQTLVDERGTNEQQRLAEASWRYREDHGESFWSALVEAEAGGERHVGTTGSVEWLAPFAPKHHRHVYGVTDADGPLSADDDRVRDLATGLTNVLAGYADAGLNAFNFALYLQEDPAFPPVVEVVARSVFGEYYWSDSPFFTSLHHEAVVDAAPETYAAELTQQF